MYSAYVDGACRKGNPGVTSCAFILYKKEELIEEKGFYLGPELQTNNYAEFQGLLRLLEFLDEKNFRNVIIHCDSMLVVNQVNQLWNVNNEDLRPMVSRAYGLLVRGAHVIKHIKGHDGNPGNEAADALCNKVLDDYLVDRGTSWKKI